MSEAREGSRPEWDVMVARNVQVPMRDGVRLATDLYFPARDGQRCAGPLPVLLLRTPYDKGGNSGTGEYYARRGYVFACQDVRGRYASAGTFYAFAGEERDGFDAVEWQGLTVTLDVEAKAKELAVLRLREALHARGLAVWPAAAV